MWVRAGSQEPSRGRSSEPWIWRAPRSKHMGTPRVPHGTSGTESHRTRSWKAAALLLTGHHAQAPPAAPAAVIREKSQFRAQDDSLDESPMYVSEPLAALSFGRPIFRPSVHAGANECGSFAPILFRLALRRRAEVFGVIETALARAFCATDRGLMLSDVKV